MSHAQVLSRHPGVQITMESQTSPHKRREMSLQVAYHPLARDQVQLARDLSGSSSARSIPAGSGSAGSGSAGSGSGSADSSPGSAPSSPAGAQVQHWNLSTARRTVRVLFTVYLGPVRTPSTRRGLRPSDTYWWKNGGRGKGKEGRAKGGRGEEKGGLRIAACFAERFSPGRQFFWLIRGCSLRDTASGIQSTEEGSQRRTVDAVELALPRPPRSLSELR